MNIEFLLYAKYDENRLTPSRDRLFKAIISSLNEVNINPLIFLSEYSIIQSENNDKSLVYSFHPSSDPIYIEYRDKTIYITISTGTFGAGYHRFVIGVLDRIARRLDVVFKEDENYKDPSGYFYNRDFDKLQEFFENSLVEYSKALFSHYDNGFSSFMISMPYDYPMIEKDYFALSCLGYWGKSWFKEFISARERKSFLNEFFIWHNEEMDKYFWLKSLNSLVWLFFPFREMIDDREKELYKKIIYSFNEAFKKDSKLQYCWDILISIALYLNDENLAVFIKEKKLPNDVHIGFRTEMARYNIAGGFSIILPMRMNMYRNNKALVEFKDISIYIAMQVFTFENKEIDDIREYVLHQIDIAEEDKGNKVDIKANNKDIEIIAYEAILEDNDYMITVASVTNKLAMLSWFTFNGLENKEICIEAIKSISIL